MPNQKRPSTTAQADRVDYLMSVLCVLTILDILTLPLTAIVGIFWVKQYELPMMGEGFSTKINGKKLRGSLPCCCFPVQRWAPLLCRQLRDWWWCLNSGCRGPFL